MCHLHDSPPSVRIVTVVRGIAFAASYISVQYPEPLF
jgi:hypothetical protein